MNVITFCGRLAKPAEIRNTQSGKSVTSFETAVDLGFGDNKKTLWIKCAWWGERGEKVSQYLGKGQEVTVTGRLADLEAFAKRDGSNGAAIKVDVIDLKLHGGKREAGQDAPTPGASGFEDDLEIPF